MIRRIQFTAFAALFAAAVGCGSSNEAQSVYEEDEMAKYRSTPEMIAAGMAQGAAASNPDADAMAEIENSSIDAAEAAEGVPDDEE